MRQLDGRLVVLVQKGNQILDLLLVLQPGKRHLRSGHFCLRVLDVFGECRFVPGNAGVLVGRRVAETLDGAGRIILQS